MFPGVEANHFAVALKAAGAEIVDGFIPPNIGLNASAHLYPESLGLVPQKRVHNAQFHDAFLRRYPTPQLGHMVTAPGVAHSVQRGPLGHTRIRCGGGSEGVGCEGFWKHFQHTER
jgi:hypothetical protein